ncbi:MAG: hypothetical protein ACE5LH_00610 [Fidelibacterota bacterium]
MRFLAVPVLAFLGACSLWEYEDPSSPLENGPPETFLTLAAADTLYARVDTVIVRTDPGTGEEIRDTVWTYAIGEEPDPGLVWDTLTSAFTTITTSRQELHWWGEDRDGHVIGYRYRWNVDTAWTFTTRESAVFFLPVTREMDVFTFQVVAVDDDSAADPTPARIVLPIRNSRPEVSFRFRSNPLVDNPLDTSFTFPTRTFVWDVEDQDGIETVTDIFYALDDTCGSCWTRLDAASYSSITLTGLSPGIHTFYLKARDIAGAESEIIHFPDRDDPSTPNTWAVMPVQGDILLVDDFPQDTRNSALSWYRGILDSLVGPAGYSVWEIGDELPFSSTDVNANLNYFDHVIWYTAYTGVETYDDAGTSILQFMAGGGNIFMNAAQLKDTSFVWFPMDSSFVLNPSGRLFSGRVLVSQVDSTLNLAISKLIAIRVKGFETDTATAPYFESLYRLQEPESGDEWTGTPNVCGEYQFELEPGRLSGKAVLMSIPLHNGSEPLLEGRGSASKFLAYLLEKEFGL